MNAADPESERSENHWDIFLSYSSEDRTLVQKIQRYIERFKLPNGGQLKVFRDETDIRSGNLPNELNDALAVSHCLAVCCSPSSKRSVWVAREIEEYQRTDSRRPIVPLILSGEPDDVLPSELGSAETRYCDLRSGWGLMGPRKETRAELIRLIASASDLNFRELLPLDELRRRRLRRSSMAAIAAVAATVSLWPIATWRSVALDGMQIYGCDGGADGISLYAMNPLEAEKAFFQTLRLDAEGVQPTPEPGFARDRALTGRLLPARAYEPTGCGGSRGWIGAPAPGLCVSIEESDETTSIDVPGGGFEMSGTMIRIGNSGRQRMDAPWSRIDQDYWSQLGERVSPSEGLPISIDGDDVWLGLPVPDSGRRSLWHHSNHNEDWTHVLGVNHIDSLRRLGIGLLIAGRVDRELGFFLLNKRKHAEHDYFEYDLAEYEGPRTGSDLEVCGEIESQPVLRVDQNVFVRGYKPRIAGAGMASGSTF